MKDSFLNLYFSYPSAIGANHGHRYLLVGVMNIVPRAPGTKDSETNSRFLMVILPTPYWVPTWIGFEMGIPYNI